MSVCDSRVSGVSPWLVGLIAGCFLSCVRPAMVFADGVDRAGETIMATGPLLVRYDEATKAPIPLEALYILDYKAGRLRASLPTFRQSTQSTTIIESFVERDLAADFKIDLDRGPRPHFLMTTGSLGPYTAGWAPLYVIETTSSQIGVYRLDSQKTTGKSGRPKLELLQMQAYDDSSAASKAEAASREKKVGGLDQVDMGKTIMATGPVLVRYDEATRAPIPLDAIYILDYSARRLRASLPTFRQSAQSTTIIESFAERDLAADFKVDFDRGPRPRFLMTTGSLGPGMAGWAPLYVIETTSNQIGVYQIHIEATTGRSARPRFELVQMRPYITPSTAGPADQ
jgi:hypothetical protein